MGNICRSPLAQGVFENVLRREGLEYEVFVDSAGTGAWHVGSPPDERAQKRGGLRGAGPGSTSAPSGRAPSRLKTATPSTISLPWTRTTTSRLPPSVVAARW